MFRTSARRNVVGNLQGFVRQELGPCQLDECQGTTNLADTFDSTLQQAAAMPLDDESFKIGFSFLYGREQLFANQAQSSRSSHHGALRLLRQYNFANVTLDGE
ncbi:hypothetical protein [Pseudomonas oryzihabitans]|uniref:hypothetical protein n=1 Tax=Pseudomonas oryzihabitans TaxID=47885 RepID=UPI00286300EC|nr:hypothetical protein [Pseudomonas psychrotolerans]MDR6676494.1 hypothetical protein [Pseudomonas psychrotolerans]